MTINRRGLIFCFTLPVTASAASAQEPAANPSLSKAWVIEAGAVLLNVGGGLSAITTSGHGGSFNFARLGLDGRETTFATNLRWRFSSRWRLDLRYDAVEASGSLANTASVEFGRVTIPAGYEIASVLDAKAYSSFLGYAFSKGHLLEFGGRIGLSILDATASVTGRGSIGGKISNAGPESIDILTPVPTLGLYATYAFDDQLAFEGAIDGIAGGIGIYSGHYLQLNAGLKYWLSDTLAIAGGYRLLDARTERDGNAVDSRVDVRTHGAYLNASIGF